jgi:hypothetical protein
VTVRSINAYALVNPAPLVPGPPAPTDYHADQIDILYDLIEKSNPGFKAQYPKGKLLFGVPSTVALVPSDPYKTDTSILISPAPGSGVVGSQTVRYRRIDVGVIFKHMTLKMSDYSVTTTLAVATWKASFIKKFGVSIPAADITNSAVLTSGVLTNINIATTSLCYKGTVQLTWTVGARPFPSFITDANRALVGRLYPGGNDFSGARKPQGEFQAYCQDASAIGATIEAYAAVFNVGAGDNTAATKSLIDWLNSTTGRTNWSTAASTTDGGIGGITWYRYTIPSAPVPEANSAKYNRCLVIQGVAGSWFGGKIIIHYNV